MNAPAAITVTPILVGDLLAGSDRIPIYVHVIDHPDARVLVDTGLTDLHPAVADLDPRIRPPNTQEFDLASVDIVVNTHLHFDHCGGNHLFAGKPIYVQRRELDDARNEEDYTIREWVDAPGMQYVPVDGDVAVWFGELDEPTSDGQLHVRALDPEQVWLTHVREPWRVRTGAQRPV